jgi:hypothetical protein
MEFTQKRSVVFLLVFSLFLIAFLQEIPTKAVQKPAPVAKKEQKPSKKKKAAELIEGKYQKIEVNACDLSGKREKNVVVDIGFGKREYWSFTNDFGQLVKVTAEEITVQIDEEEKVLKSGRYCEDEAKVPGTEKKNLDEGHVVADSLGGVSNAYNITPQDSVLNRHGNQSYFEKAIRDAGGCKNFTATITYPNEKTQVPSTYKLTCAINGNITVVEFENEIPEKYETKSEIETKIPKNAKKEIEKIDRNKNGIISINEAKKSGFSMPISKKHWLYPYMQDADGDGVVGE